MARLLTLCLCIALAGCSNWYKPVQVSYSRAEVTGTNLPNSPLAATIGGYSQTISEEMNRVIGQLATPLTKSDGENTLGNFVADALLFGANKTYGNVNIAIMNRGGIRLPELAEGPVTKGKIFELHPFDNLLLCYTVSGDQLAEILANRNLINAEWHIAGASLVAKNWQVGNQPVNSASTYRLAISDYLANVSEDKKIPANQPPENKNYLQRDAIIDYIGSFSQPIQAPPTNRIKP